MLFRSVLRLIAIANKLFTTLKAVIFRIKLTNTLKWNYQPPSQEQTEAAKALAKETGINPVLCKLLLERGITSAAEAKRFFRPQLSELHDPFLMKDMSIAVERLNQAMGKKERILVYGDYDVDGTDRKSTRLNSSHIEESRMPSSA